MKRGEMTTYLVDPPASANQTLMGPPPVQPSHPLHSNHFILPPNQNQSNFNAGQFDNFRRHNQSQNVYGRRHFDTSRQPPVGRNFSKADYAVRFPKLPQRVVVD